jgi:hypothetical protein
VAKLAKNKTALKIRSIRPNVPFIRPNVPFIRPNVLHSGFPESLTFEPNTRYIHSPECTLHSPECTLYSPECTPFGISRRIWGLNIAAAHPFDRMVQGFGRMGVFLAQIASFHLRTSTEHLPDFARTLDMTWNARECLETRVSSSIQVSKSRTQRKHLENSLKTPKNT